MTDGGPGEIGERSAASGPEEAGPPGQAAPPGDSRPAHGAALRVGLGYDAHRLAADRPLVLGGVRFRDTDGLCGHSDADVLVHAVMDALLGAAGLEDIGYYFPDRDPAYAGADSIVLLARVRDLLAAGGWEVVNVDAVVICERPRIAPERQRMRERMAAALKVDSDRVGVRGTTTEGMGFTGREEGIAAQAVALVRRRGSRDAEVGAGLVPEAAAGPSQT
jgi:2-C-methyl-D-erythritol 2,4-cyclodiphosphate synthase